mgnify:CR=1 FL=1
MEIKGSSCAALAVFVAMVASVLPGLVGGVPLTSESWRVMRGEGDIAGPLRALAGEYADLSFGSYPFQEQGRFGANVVVRGADPALVATAYARLQEMFPDG